MKAEADKIAGATGRIVSSAVKMCEASVLARAIADALSADELSALHDALGRLRDPLGEAEERRCKGCGSVKPMHSTDKCRECVAESAAWYERVMSIKPRSDAPDPDDRPLAVGDEVEVVGPSIASRTDRKGRRDEVEDIDCDGDVWLLGGGVYKPTSLRRIPPESGEADCPKRGHYVQRNDLIYGIRGGFRRACNASSAEAIVGELNRLHADIARLTRERDDARAERDDAESDLARARHELRSLRATVTSAIETLSPEVSS